MGIYEICQLAKFGIFSQTSFFIEQAASLDETCSHKTAASVIYHAETVSNFLTRIQCLDLKVCQ